MKRKLLLAALIAVCIVCLALGIAGCSAISNLFGGGSSSEETVSVESVSISETSLILLEGESETLTATVYPSNATNQNVSWSSSDKSVATVTSNGTVNAVSEGEATIKVTTSDGGKTATCSVTVYDSSYVAVESVSLNKTSLSLSENESDVLTATVYPSDATDKSVTWSSSDESVATVSQDGTVTAVSAGEATITATSSNGMSDSCAVTVTDAYADFEFTESGDGYSVKAYKGSSAEVIIPSQYNGLDVISIGSNAFKNCTSLTSVTIPDSVTSIGSDAFYKCTALKSVTMGSGVESIGSYAFEYCSSLTSITIPDSVTSIGSYAFEYCSSLTSVTIPDSVTSIGTYAFYDCTSLSAVNISDIAAWCGISFGIYDNPLFYSHNLYLNGNLVTDLTIPDGVTSIGSCGFYSASITSVTIPEGVTSIGMFAFCICASLTSVTIPESVTFMGQGAFSNCTGLTEINYNAAECGDFSKNNYEFTSAGQDGDGVTVNIGSNVKKIPAYLFCPETSAESPKIISLAFKGSSSCESIGAYAFAYCSSLTNITIPENVTSIGTYAFYNCTALTEINYNAVNCDDLYSNNCVFYQAGQDGEGIIVNIGSNVTKIPAYLFCPSSSSSYAPEIVTVVFADDCACESIGSYAFYGCTSLESITIPDSVTSIGSDAFDHCTSLTSVTIGSGVTTIGTYAFYYCTSLTSVTIPDSVTTIGSYAFDGCTALESITIGSGVTSIDNDAFYNCTALTEINYNAAECSDLSSSNYVFCEAGQSGEGIAVNIGSSVTKIPAYLFYPSIPSTLLHPLKITSVVFAGSKCKSIGSHVFAYCTSLTDITIPSSVTSIGNNAFYDCTSLMSVTIGSGVTSIGDYAFYECSSLTSITIPNSVTSIGKYAFEYCSALESVTIGSGVTILSASLFAYCTSLTSIIIPDTVTSINPYCFDSCTSLASATIGSGVTYIGVYAFRNCSSLTSVTFKVTSGWYAMANATASSYNNISSSKLSNKNNAAIYLTSSSEYLLWYWYRT